jgi:hypothetical protein
MDRWMEGWIGGEGVEREGGRGWWDWPREDYKNENGLLRKSRCGKELNRSSERELTPIH